MPKIFKTHFFLGHPVFDKNSGLYFIRILDHIFSELWIIFYQNSGPYFQPQLDQPEMWIIFDFLQLQAIGSPKWKLASPQWKLSPQLIFQNVKCNKFHALQQKIRATACFTHFCSMFLPRAITMFYNAYFCKIWFLNSFCVIWQKGWCCLPAAILTANFGCGAIREI